MRTTSIGAYAPGGLQCIVKLYPTCVPRDGRALRTHVEYVGFSADDVYRRYTLRVRLATDETHDFVLMIPNEAFLSRRLRYQDAPEICYLRLQRDLTTYGEALPPDQQSVTDADIDEYRIAHAPKPPRQRPAAG